MQPGRRRCAGLLSANPYFLRLSADSYSPVSGYAYSIPGRLLRLPTATLWLLLELANLTVFTLMILPRKQPVDARPLLPATATRLLRLTLLIPILVFGYSLFFSHQTGPMEWGCLILVIVGNALVIKGKWDLGESHTWTGYYLPRAKRVTYGIFAWIAHPMYIGIILTIISCSLVYTTRSPIWLSTLGLICCFYIVGFSIMVALREDRQLVQV